MVKIIKTKKVVNPSVIVENKIFLIRGQKVMLDSDLAQIYQIQTKVLLQAVKRNIERFPKDFMFQLTEEEFKNMRSQFVTSIGASNRSQIMTGSGDQNMRLQIETSNKERGGRRYLPYAFTEHGIAMLSSVLNSPRAIEMNIYIIRMFVKMREMFLQDKNHEIRIKDLEGMQKLHSEALREISELIKSIFDEPLKPLGHLGFKP